jgi:hypothetical protein
MTIRFETGDIVKCVRLTGMTIGPESAPIVYRVRNVLTEGDDHADDEVTLESVPRWWLANRFELVQRINP